MKCCEHKQKEERVLFQLVLVNEGLVKQLKKLGSGNTTRLCERKTESKTVGERKAESYFT